PPSGLEEPAAADALAELVGTSLAHFQIEALAGRGALGAVFRARDQKNGQLVALKVLAEEFPKNDVEKIRFLEAMKLMLPLKHPNLVALLGTGKAKALCWLAQEYVDGASVKSLLE